MTTQQKTDAPARILSINVSPGGIPKTPVDRVYVTRDGLAGDGHAHAKHSKPHRAISLIDEEVLEQLREEGYPVYPGATGENLTVANLHVQRLTPGTRLHMAGGVVIELSEARKPCFVLDAIDPKLKEAIVERCGFMARVITEGEIESGAAITVMENDASVDAGPSE